MTPDQSFQRPPDSEIPDGYRWDPFTPEAYVLRCPECELRSTVHTYPDRGVLRHCGVIRGVTPISEDQSRQKAPGRGSADA